MTENTQRSIVAINIKMTEAERSEYMAIAHAEGFTVADLVRAYLRSYADAHRETAHKLLMEKAAAVNKHTAQ